MSSVIRIISKKVTKVTSYGIPRNKFTEYTNSLSEAAKCSSGFVSSESYWATPVSYLDNSHTSMKIVSISNWKSLKDWNNWYNSNKRKEINEKYSDIIESENFDILQKKAPTDDIFLL